MDVNMVMDMVMDVQGSISGADLNCEWHEIEIDHQGTTRTANHPTHSRASHTVSSPFPLSIELIPPSIPLPSSIAGLGTLISTLEIHPPHTNNHLHLQVPDRYSRGRQAHPHVMYMVIARTWLDEMEGWRVHLMAENPRLDVHIGRGRGRWREDGSREGVITFICFWFCSRSGLRGLIDWLISRALLHLSHLQAHFIALYRIALTQLEKYSISSSPLSFLCRRESPNNRTIRRKKSTIGLNWIELTSRTFLHISASTLSILSSIRYFFILIPSSIQLWRTDRHRQLSTLPKKKYIQNGPPSISIPFDHCLAHLFHPRINLSLPLSWLCDSLP